MSQQAPPPPLFEGVAPRSLNVLNAVYTHQPQTFAELAIDTPGRVTVLNLFADWMNIWKDLSLKNINQEHINFLNHSLQEMKEYNLNLTWLENHLQEIHSKLASQRIFKMNNEIEGLETEIENLRNQVQQLEEESQRIQANLLNLSANEHIEWHRPIIQGLLGNEF